MRRRSVLAGAAFAAGLCLATVRPGLCAGAGEMTRDVLDALGVRGVTAPSTAKPAPSGPVAPTAPTAPVAPSVSGAPSSPGGGAASFTSPAGRAAAGRVLTLRHGGVSRRAIVIAPRGGKSGPAPTLIFLHGAGESAEQGMRQTGMAVRAPAAGFLAVFPEGLGGEQGDHTWNAWDCCGYARAHRVDDVGFLAALVDKLEKDGLADPHHIYLAGFSNGAVLASRFALERPGVARAIAAVSGDLPCDAPVPSVPLPVLLVNGARDQLSRLAPTRWHPATGRFCADRPAAHQAEVWARGMGLGAPRVTDAPTAPVRELAYGPRASGGRGLLRWYILKRGGHAWPGGASGRYPHCDAPSRDLDATGLILRFFSEMR